MAYAPNFRLTIWPADDYTGAGTPFGILSGTLKRSAYEASAELDFDIPTDWDELFDNYAAFATTMLQTGAWVMLETTELGNFTDARCWFLGHIWEVERRRVDGMQTRHYTCRDRNARKRSINGNVHKSAQILIYETTFAAADFNTDDPDFTVDIPDNGEDWQPGGCMYLVAQYNDGSENHVHDYDKDEYTYAAARKQIMFHTEGGGEGTAGPPQTKKGEGWTWTIRLAFYNQADTGDSVNDVLELVATGTPWSLDGGLGWLAADVNLDLITSFDGVSPKLIRTIQFKKTDGPLGQLDDAMRDAGLIPVNYWLRHDPITDTYRGSFLTQVNGSALTPLHGVIEDFEPYSLEGIGGRVENHAGNNTPVNYALNATVTDNLAGLNAIAAGLGIDAFTLVGADANIRDGKNATFVQFQSQHFGTGYFPGPLATPQDMIVLKLDQLRTIERCMFRHTHPQQAAGAGWEDFVMYLVLRLPRVTISGSEYRIAAPFATAVDVVTSDTIFSVDDASGFQLGDFIMVTVGATTFGTVIQNIAVNLLTVSPACTGVSNGDKVLLDNPGVPLGSDTINVALDPQNVDDSGRDIDAECDLCQRVRYVAIRWEQDFFYRNTDPTGKLGRQLWYGASELRLLGDEVLRYVGGDDDGLPGYAQITDKGSYITALVADPHQFTLDSITGIEGVWAAVGQKIQLERGAGGTIYNGTITNRVGNTITVSWVAPGPAHVFANDKVGWRRRWQIDFTGVWRDLYCPKLYRKIYNTSHWLEIITDEQASDVWQAEMLCLDRVLQLIKISRNKSVTVMLDHRLGIGVTMRTYAGEDPWLPTEETLHLNPRSENAEEQPPPVILALKGSDYEGVPE